MKSTATKYRLNSGNTLISTSNCLVQHNLLDGSPNEGNSNFSHLTVKPFLTSIAPLKRVFFGFLFLALFLGASTNGWGQTGVTAQIGSGTATSPYMPIHPYYGYTYSQSIYTSAELSAAGAVTNGYITKIRYNVKRALNANSTGWTVYLGNTTKTSFTNTTNWVTIANLTQVYTGTVSTGTGWIEITLDTPFQYTGNNLVVAVDENTPSYTNSSNTDWFYGYTGATDRGIYYYSDGTNPDPSSPPTGTRVSVLPQIQFFFPNYAAQTTSVNYGSSPWCIGETRNVSITVKNVGSRTWYASGSTNCASTNLTVAASFKWNADAGFDSYTTPPFSNRNPIPNDVAPGGSVTITFPVRTPNGDPTGANNLSINLIAQECEWFSPVVYTSPSINVNAIPATPTATASPSTISCGGSSQLSVGDVSILFSEDFESYGQMNVTTTTTPWRSNGNYNGSFGWDIWNHTGQSSSGSYGLATYCGGNGVTYCNTTNNNVVYYTTPFNTTSGYLMDFKWRAGGETNYDYGNVVYSTNGTTWTDLSGPYVLQYTTWQTVTSLALPASATLYIGFRWRNDGSVGTAPGFVIDDIVIRSNKTYSWSPATSLSNENIANPIASPTATQTYTVKATSNGCTSAPSAPVTVAVTPLVISGAGAVCLNGSLDLSVPNEWTSLPTGGTVTTHGNEKMHVFNNTNATGFQAPNPISAKVLVVAGGGGGGRRHAGGGGAGGVLFNSFHNISAGNHPITIGTGGSAGTGGDSDFCDKGGNGGNSIFNTLTAIGGGGGAGNENGPGNNGGSGGGGSNQTSGGTGTIGQGNNGGNITTNVGFGAGGGGAALAAGNSGTAGTNGGNGVDLSSHFGTTVGVSGIFGGGGSNTATRYNGGSGGGGQGGGNTAATKTGISGTANTGGGGGGGGAVGNASATNNGSGGAGGSGVVIIRYRVPSYNVVSNTATGTTINALTGVITAGSTAGTITVSYTNEFGCTSDAVVITVNPTPTATLTSSNSTICHGNTVTLSGTVSSGGTVTINNGVGAATTSGTTWSAVVTPTATTTYAIASVTNTGCTGTGSGSTTVTLPTAGTTLSQNGETATCIVNGNNIINFYHSSGRLIASINPNGQNLGSVTATSYVDAGLAVPACGDPTNPNYVTATMGRHWVIKPTNQPASAVLVGLPFSPSEYSSVAAASLANVNPNDNLTGIGSLKLSKYSGTNEDHLFSNNCGNGTTTLWTQSSSGLVNSYISPFNGTDQFASFSIPSFSEFWLHGQTSSPLPVTLTNFSASCDKQVILNWSTASEQNSDRFIVEKSRDGQTWSWVATQTAAGNSNTTLHYTQTDENSWNGLTYYRLRQVDFNGDQEVYGPISVSCENNENGLTVYPNPNSGMFTVEISSDEMMLDAQLILTDMTGKIIASRKANVAVGTTQIMLEDLELEMGTYLISLSGSNSRNKQLKPVKVIVKQ